MGAEHELVGLASPDTRQPLSSPRHLFGGVNNLEAGE